MSLWISSTIPFESLVRHKSPSALIADSAHLVNFSIATLTILKRIPTEVNAAFACVMLVASFARFKTPMAMFSGERTPYCPFGPWSVETTRKWCDVQDAGKSPRPIETSVNCDLGDRIARLVQSD